jgi:mannitol/fructose-specific phosphotransferase system IIA component (Ntr-type)
MVKSETIAHLRSAAFINPVLARTDTEAIDELLAALRNHPEVINPIELRAAVLQRQKVDPPLLPMGIAFPHARTDSVRSLISARCPSG